MLASVVVSVWEPLDQPRVSALLRGALERDRVAHAYLFSGPPGAPLVDAALAFAMAGNCISLGETGSADPCGLCEQCSKIASGIHPDVVTLIREGAAQIVPIETVRTQVLGRVGIPPHEAKVRVFIVEEATAVQPAAANALLKTLEEPPARTVFVLCTTAPEQLLPTIRSRCQRVRFGGGGALPIDADPARGERIDALAGELAGDRHDVSLPSRISEGKGDTGPVLIAAARKLHTVARTAVIEDRDRARRASARAQTILSWHTAVAIHNASPQLAIEALVVQLDALAPVS